MAALQTRGNILWGQDKCVFPISALSAAAVGSVPYFSSVDDVFKEHC